MKINNEILKKYIFLILMAQFPLKIHSHSLYFSCTLVKFLIFWIETTLSFLLRMQVYLNARKDFSKNFKSMEQNSKIFAMNLKKGEIRSIIKNSFMDYLKNIDINMKYI